MKDKVLIHFKSLLKSKIIKNKNLFMKINKNKKMKKKNLNGQLMSFKIKIKYPLN